MDAVQIIPWVLFALAVAFGAYFAVRASEQARREAQRARQEAEAARRAEFASLQAQLAELREPSERESAQLAELAEITRELAALRERVSSTGAELGKLHDHDREIRSMMSGLLSKARRLAEDDDEEELAMKVPQARVKRPTRSGRDAMSETDSLHLDFLKKQEAQLEEIRKKSQRLNLMPAPATAAAQDRERNSEAIFKAIRAGDLEGMRKAVKLGGEVNGIDRHNGYTPLHLAAREGNSDLVAELLSLGADPSAADNFGKTPMRLAQEVANGDCVELLRKAEAS